MPKKLQRKVAVRRPVRAPAEHRSERSSSLFSGGGRVTQKLLSEFTSQLSVLLDAGLPVTRSLRILEGQMPQGSMRRVVLSLVEDVEGGTSLSEGMTKHPRVFDGLYTNMVRAGEAGGIQEEILGRLAQFMEKNEAIKSRVRGALAYPIAISAVATLVLGMVFIFVIPQFKEIFESLLGDADRMHWTTRTVIQTGEHLQGWWWVYVLSAASVYGLHCLLLVRSPGYRRVRDACVLRVPMFGGLLRKSLVARFSRTFGTLVQSGVPHLGALEIVEGSIANVHMQRAVNTIHASIREGAGIAAPMGESGMFDDIVVNMVDVGEQTGELDRMLSKIADRYETEIDRSVEVTFKVIEPILLVVMAVVVGFIVYALFTPLLQIMEALRG
jgi:type IV pilus assembly protein PilC